jgi:hypothetical protein
VTIFDYLKDIIVTKKGDLPLDEYVPFLVNRWLSFINPTLCLSINQVNSKILLENKELHYKTMISFFPKMKYSPRINYIKKIKDTDIEIDLKAKAIAQRCEISNREAMFLLGSIDRLSS